MSVRCNYCENKKHCDICDDMRKDKFIPTEEVKQYFKIDEYKNDVANLGGN